MASDDVATVAMGSPLNPRKVIADPNARHYGADLSDRTLVPRDGAILGETRFEDWLD